MKLTTALVISSALSAHATHPCNDFISNLSGPRKFWMNKRRTDQETEQEQEPDLLHRHDMHSYTGAEGIDHHLKDRDRDACNECKRSPRAHKKVMQASSDLIHRHDMHSFLGAEGINHHTEGDFLDEPAETPVVKHMRRRLDWSRASNSVNLMDNNSNKATKETVQVNVPGDTLDEPSDTPVVKHTRRRLDRSKTSNSIKSMDNSSNKATKTVQADVPGERLSSTIYFNHGY